MYSPTFYRESREDLIHKWGLARQPQCRAVFQGPHAYVSPAWYQPKPDNVPTWN